VATLLVKPTPFHHSAIFGAVLGALVIYGVGAKADEVVKYEIADGNSIPKSLTGMLGDPERGRKVAINRKQGNCLACHKMPIPEQAFHGEVGPDLAGVASRYKEGELRLRVVDSKALNPDTIMPAFYRNSGLNRVMKKFQGKSVLTAEQVEDVVAYLLTLKGQ
jgi:sulfur-oxidizing protein SoxX